MGEVLSLGRVRVEVRSLDPARAEVWVSANAGPESSRGRAVLALDGKIRGPRCRYSQTVEVVYPLREVPTGHPCELLGRVVIPEPNLWDVQSPFMYGGTVQLLADGQPGDSRAVAFGLRDLRIGPSGVRCNGRPVALHGHTLDDRGGPVPWDDLRRRGVNLIQVPAEEGTAGRWSEADAVGCLVVYGLTDGEFAHRLALELAQHPCGLGWVVPAERINEPFVADLLGSAEGPTLPLGMELREPPTAPVPPAVRFVICPPAVLGALSEVTVLKLVRDEGRGGALSPVPPAG
jgi:hypothetical protein